MKELIKYLESIGVPSVNVKNIKEVILIMACEVRTYGDDWELILVIDKENKIHFISERWFSYVSPEFEKLIDSLNLKEIIYFVARRHNCPTVASIRVCCRVFANNQERKQKIFFVPSEIWTKREKIEKFLNECYLIELEKYKDKKMYVYNITHKLNMVIFHDV